MKTAGIIAEYNPFHNGHAYQIAKLRSDGYDTIICVCSPSVVQRGSFAIFPPAVRTKAALSGGADLILTLPAPYACKSAEGFAQAAVYILCALGVCDVICFGTESADTKEFMRIARLLNSSDFNCDLRLELKKGVSFAKATEHAAANFDMDINEMLNKPNNILGVEYCKALYNFYSPDYCKADLWQKTRAEREKLPPKMPKPYAICRQGANHDEKIEKSLEKQAEQQKVSKNEQKNDFERSFSIESSEHIVSASALRQILLQGKAAKNSECDKGENTADFSFEHVTKNRVNTQLIENFVPKSCAKIYREAVQNKLYSDNAKAEIAILSRLRAMTIQEMQKIRLASEGLDNKLYKAVQKASSLEELYTMLKSKRYAHSRVRRLVLDAALEYGEDLPFLPPFIHIAGASANGLKALSRIEKVCTLDISHSLAALSNMSESAKKVVQAHSKAQDLSALCMKKNMPCGTAYTDKFVVYKDTLDEG